MIKWSIIRNGKLYRVNWWISIQRQLCRKTSRVSRVIELVDILNRNRYCLQYGCVWSFVTYPMLSIVFSSGLIKMILQGFTSCQFRMWLEKLLDIDYSIISWTEASIVQKEWQRNEQNLHIVFANFRINSLSKFEWLLTLLLVAICFFRLNIRGRKNLLAQSLLWMHISTQHCNQVRILQKKKYCG